MNKQVLRILEMHIHTHIDTCKRIFMYAAVCVCVCGIFILKIISKYLPVG